MRKSRRQQELEQQLLEQQLLEQQQLELNPPTGYSYIRFSSPEQAEGDSLIRQTEKSVAWCERNGVVLDKTLTLRDLGVSAFRGKHRTDDKNALSQFLTAVERGRIARGSYLIVESLDRLSRENVMPALTVLLNLIQHGVRVVQLFQSRRFTTNRPTRCC
jgi:DNA invertase Pin-like site-specific DNA recombinase